MHPGRPDSALPAVIAMTHWRLRVERLLWMVPQVSRD
jgi:hypothetical protein